MNCSAVLGYKSYQNQLPNGGSVPHPCKPNYIWQGVGHRNVQGGGDRNPFGAAFEAAGYVSTPLLHKCCTISAFFVRVNMCPFKFDFLK